MPDPELKTGPTGINGGPNIEFEPAKSITEIFDL